MVAEAVEPSCFGTFQSLGGCVECAASEWCKDFTLRLDLEAMERDEGADWWLDGCCFTAERRCYADYERDTRSTGVDVRSPS